jgi:hypothetical protein
MSSPAWKKGTPWLNMTMLSARLFIRMRSASVASAGALAWTASKMSWLSWAET